MPDFFVAPMELLGISGGAEKLMKKIIASGLMTGLAIAGLAVGAGTANARPYCETGSYPGTGSVCVGGPYGPVAVQWLPDSTYSVPAPADISAAFGEENHQVICDLIAQEPTPHGIWGANSYLLTAQDVSLNMNYRQMQNASGYAVSNHCTQYAQVYAAYRSKYP